MARPVILSNSELHVGINNYGLVHDFYYPYVGLENHAAGHSLRHKVGVWVDGRLSWLDDGNWQQQLRLSNDGLIGHSRSYNQDLGVSLEFDDFVASDVNAFFRNIHVVNHSDVSRDIRLFMHQAFIIGDSHSNTDTAQYLPDSNAILHYRGRRAFVIGGRELNGESFDQRSIGLFGIEGREGTWRDADDGELSNGDVEHGRVDSTIRFSMHVSAHSSHRVHYWIAAGTSVSDAASLHGQIEDNGLYEYMNRTHAWWQGWLKNTYRAAESVPAEYKQEFINSSLIIKSHIDKRGAIIASTDSALLKQSRDAYSYCWGRDGAYAIWPLIRMGYREEPQKFFEFCKSVLHPNGYLGHKYRADGSLGPSWHPYAHGENVTPPIQEDETAGVLFMFCQFYQSNPSRAMLDLYYDSFVKRMADFLQKFIDRKTGLPLPTYELWEERYIVSTYTTSIVQAALRAAAELAEVANDPSSAVSWRNVADDIVKAAKDKLFDSNKQTLIKGLVPTDDGYESDNTIDLSSFYGAFIYGLFPITSDELVKTLETIESTLMRETPGLPRYENDPYQHRSDTDKPNDWIITSLWRAQYLIEVNELEKAKQVLKWVADSATETGMLSEQIHPDNGTSVSVLPLIWSHAELMSTLLDLKEESNV